MQSVEDYKAQGRWPIPNGISALGIAPEVNRLANELGRQVIGVELGVALGENMTYFMEQCPNLNLYGIDPWFSYKDWDGNIASQETMDQYHAMALKNLAPYIGTRAHLIRNISKNASDLFADESIDYVFIDGDHSYECAKMDMYYWYPKVRRGGIFSGHDIQLPAVQKALGEFVNERGIVLPNNGRPNLCDVQAWWWRK